MSKGLLGLIMILAALGVGVGLVMPQIGSVHTLSVEADANRQYRDLKEQRLTALTNLKSVFAGQPDQIAKIMTSLPQEPQIPEVLASIEAMAKETGVNFSSITPQNDTHGKRVNVTISGDGDLNTIERFIDALRQNKRPISVTTVNLSRRDDNRLSYSLGVYFPYIPTSAGQATGGTSTPPKVK